MKTRMPLPTGASQRAFSMLEVMIAVGIFFTAVFFILQLTSQQLRIARSLQTLDVDTGTLPSLIVMTNMLEEGALPMEIKSAFEENNPGFAADGMVLEVGTNGLFRVDYAIRWRSGEQIREARNSILMWRPSSSGQRRRLRQ